MSIYSHKVHTLTYLYFYLIENIIVGRRKLLILDRIKNSVVIQAALKGIRPAVIGMIFTAAIVVGQTAQMHWASLLIFAASLAAIWKLRLEVVLIIPIAGLIGLFLY